MDWEISLLDFLAGQGFRVPVAVPALDGRRRDGLVTVQTWLGGRPPRAADWPAVAAELSRLHQVTAGWPQRPGFASARELLTADFGGDISLAPMPACVAADCRRAWSGLPGSARAVVHGDPGPANIRVSSAGVGFLDWDEARVDCPDLDLADLPFTALPPGRLGVARLAVLAYQPAAHWQPTSDMAGVQAQGQRGVP